MPSRRQFLALLGTGTVTQLAGCNSSQRTYTNPESIGQSEDWSTFGHDPANTHFNPGGSAPRSDITEAWRVPANPFIQPIVADGSVYVKSNGLHKVDAATGETEWRLGNDNWSSWTPPTVVGDTMYVSDPGTNGVGAFNAETTDEQWLFETDESVVGAPTLMHTSEEFIVFGTLGERIYCVNRETGEEEWQRDAFGRIKTTMGAHFGFVYATTEAGEVYQLWYEGTGGWRQRLPDRIECAPTVGDDFVYVGCFDGHVYALDKQSGSVEWSTDVGGFVRDGLALAHDRLYVGSGTKIHALDAVSGEIDWYLDTGDSFRSTPTVVDDTVYIGDGTGVLRALKPDGGIGVGSHRIDPARWTMEFDDFVGRGLASANGKLYVPVQLSDGPFVIALETA